MWGYFFSGACGFCNELRCVVMESFQSMWTIKSTFFSSIWKCRSHRQDSEKAKLRWKRQQQQLFVDNIFRIMMVFVQRTEFSVTIQMQFGKIFIWPFSYSHFFGIQFVVCRLCWPSFMPKTWIHSMESHSFFHLFLLDISFSLSLALGICMFNFVLVIYFLWCFHLMASMWKMMLSLGFDRSFTRNECGTIFNAVFGCLHVHMCSHLLSRLLNVQYCFNGTHVTACAVNTSIHYVKWATAKAGTFCKLHSVPFLSLSRSV